LLFEACGQQLFVQHTATFHFENFIFKEEVIFTFERVKSLIGVCSCEVDPSRMTKDGDVEKNISFLLSLVEEAFSAIELSIPQIPPQVWQSAFAFSHFLIEVFLDNRLWLSCRI
jgi:hypothetical protein